jgi:phosphatidylserine/phosphatidylglycerophosphate/cardiolipin synthase-like enzyme
LGTKSLAINLPIMTSRIRCRIPLRVRHKRGFRHNKSMIIDQSIITGSFDFTVSADERNAENIVVMRDAL